MSKLIIYFTIFSLWAVIYLPNLGKMSFWEWDEPGYAQVAKEMIISGDYILPKLNDQIFLEKPPLYYWLETLSFRLFGINEFAARLPSAVSTLLTAFIIIEIGSIIFNQTLGFYAGLVHLTTLMNSTFGRSGFIDSTFVLSLVFAIYCFIRASKDNDNISWSILLGISIGLSILLKGPIGIFFFVCSYLFYLLIYKSKVEYKFILISATFCAITSLPWYLTINSKTNGQFLYDFIIGENFNRIVHKKGNSTSDMFYYLKFILIGTTPWTFFLFPLLFNIKETIKIKNIESLLLITIVTTAVILTFAATKWPHYIMPAYPLLSLFIAKEIQEANKKNNLRNHACGFLILCILINSKFYSIGYLFAEPNLQTNFWAGKNSTLIFLALGILSFIRFSKLSANQNYFFKLLLFASFTLLHSQKLPTLINKHEPLKSITNFISKNVNASENFAIYGYRNLGIPFYLQRHYSELKNENELFNFILSNKNSTIMLKQGDWHKTKENFIKLGFNKIDNYENPIENKPLIIIRK